MVRLVSVLQMADARHVHGLIAIVVRFIFCLFLRLETSLLHSIGNDDKVARRGRRIRAFGSVFDKGCRHRNLHFGYE